jgi:hypothetical protein
MEWVVNYFNQRFVYEKKQENPMIRNVITSYFMLDIDTIEYHPIQEIIHIILFQFIYGGLYPKETFEFWKKYYKVGNLQVTI